MEVCLADAVDMERSLRDINSIRNLQERFYPLLIQHAGKKMPPMHIILVLTLAIQEYTQGMPSMIASLLEMNGEHYAAAMCGDKEQEQAVRNEWLRFAKK